jgi:hypothetical protein
MVDYKFVEQQFKSCYDLIHGAKCFSTNDFLYFYKELSKAYAVKPFFQRSDYLDILYDEIVDRIHELERFQNG